jgi:hypothetical protein
MRSTKITRGRVAAAAVAVGLVAAGTVGLAQSSQATTATYTVSPKSGPGGDNNAGGTSGQPASAAKVVTINGSKFRTAANVALADGVKWSATATGCASGTAITTFQVPSATQVTATIPANELPLTAKTVNSVTTFSKKDYTLCVFDGGTLLGTGKYTVYPTPTVSGIAPASGAISGGGTVAIDGTGFTATSVVKFGNNVATQVKVATDGTSLTAKAPAGAAAGAVNVTVTTEGGVNTGTNNYTYVNAVSVSPASDSSGSAVLTVNGVGFNALAGTFATTSKVYLALGSFNAASLPTEICGSVQVVSDTQLVCTLDGTVANGAYTVVVVGDNTSAVTAAATDTDISASATYTVAPF